MSPDPEKVRRIALWLSSLARLVRSESTDAEAVAVMAAMLAIDFPESAFTQASLRAAVADLEFWPTHRRLHEALADWMADNGGPLRIAAPALENGPLDAHDRGWLDWFHKRIGEIDKLPPRVWADPAQTPRARAESLLRNQSPRAWAMIAGGS